MIENIMEVRKHSKQGKIDVHNESRTIMHMYKQQNTDNKAMTKESDRKGDKTVTLWKAQGSQAESRY